MKWVQERAGRALRPCPAASVLTDDSASVRCDRRQGKTTLTNEPQKGCTGIKNSTEKAWPPGVTYGGEHTLRKGWRRAGLAFSGGLRKPHKCLIATPHARSECNTACRRESKNKKLVVLFFKEWFLRLSTGPRNFLHQKIEAILKGSIIHEKCARRWYKCQ